MDPALSELVEGPADDEVEALAWLDPGQPPPRDLRVIARFGDVVSCRVPRGRIEAVWAHPGVRSIKASRPLAIDPNPQELEGASVASGEDAASEEAPRALSDVRRPEALPERGRGVIVACVDWGFDFAHPCFRNEDGSTRLLALWDQRAERGGPEPYGYGRVHTRASIDAALRSSTPYSALGYAPFDSDSGRGSHGTHVCDIAAGNGAGGAAPEGIAPETDLLFVHLDGRGTRGRANLGDSVALVEALDWLRVQAGDRPIVINLSVGSHGGPHNGLTLVERCIDRFVSELPGRCIVQSTGNYYEARAHASGQLAQGAQHTLRWLTDPADVTPNELELWYPGDDVLGLQVVPPYPADPISVPLGGRADIEFRGEQVGRIYHRAHDPSDGAHHGDIFLYSNAPAGTWRVQLTGERIVNGRFDAWVERDSGCRSCQSRFHEDDATPECTTGTICNGPNAITVGAYDARARAWQLGPFSSSGPTRDGRSKPELLAPGVQVLAARSAPNETCAGDALLVRNSGTSMAAPHVTGTVACIFEAAGRLLSIEETRRVLLDNLDPVPSPSYPGARIGRGCLSIERAVRAARALGEAAIEAVVDPVPVAVAQPPVTIAPRPVAEPPAASIVEPVCACPSPPPVRVIAPRPIKRSPPPARVAPRPPPAAPPPPPPRRDVPIEVADVAVRLPLGAAAALFDRRHDAWPSAVRVIGWPGAQPARAPHAGDILLRRALGEGGLVLVAQLIDARLFSASQLIASGLRCERPRLGSFARVRDLEPMLRGSAACGRFVLDVRGRLPIDTLLLSLR